MNGTLETLGIILYIFGSVIFVVTYVQLIMIAFQESTTMGVIVSLIPCFIIAYGLMRWEKTSTIVMWAWASIPMVVLGLLLAPESPWLN